MHRFGNLDTHGLARTGRGPIPIPPIGTSTRKRSEEARRADLLPVPNGGQVVDIKKSVG